MTYGGKTFDPALDEERLNEQTVRIYRLMNDSTWRTLAEISAETHDPEASVSARLRDLRKENFGSFVVERRRRGLASGGLWEYRLLPPGTAVPHVPRPVKKSGFLAGLMFGARLLVNEPDLAAAKQAMKKELLRAAGR